MQRRIVVVGDFSPWGAGFCTSILTLQFWHHTNYHSILVTYPPHAVTSPSLTNLGPVARLELAFLFAADFSAPLRTIAKAVILLVNTQINKYTNEHCRTVPSDGVFCVFIFFRWFYWRHGPHKCANTQMHK